MALNQGKTLGQVVTFYWVLCFVLSLMFPQFHVAGAAILIAVVGLGILCFKFLTDDVTFPCHLPEAKPTSEALGVTAALMGPGVLYLALTFNQEFPYAGDFDHHLITSNRFLLLLEWTLIPSFTFLILMWKFGMRKIWFLPLTLIGAFVLSLQFEPTEVILRYPSAAYTLWSPLELAWKWFDWPMPMNAARISNLLSIPIYIWILRPRIVGRWPDLRLLLIAAPFLAQKDFVFFLTSDHLEPWALVLILLGLEASVERGKEQPWLGPLICGIATVFKEQGIFALFLSYVITTLPRLNRQNFWRMVLFGIALCVPFVVYYFARSHSGVWRSVEAGNLSDAFSTERLVEYWTRLQIHLRLGFGWLIAFFALAAAGFKRLPEHRLVIALSIVLVLGTEFLFFVDKISMDYTGYPRFHYLTWPLLIVPTLLAVPYLQPRILMLLSVTFFTLNFSSALGFYKDATGSDSYRTGIEHYGMPVFYPLKTLVRKHEAQTGLVKNQKLMILNPRPSHHVPYATAAGYGSALEGYQLLFGNQALCNCREANGGILLLLDAPEESQLHALKPQKSPIQAVLKSCLPQLQSTCQTVLTEEGSNGYLLGIIASGAR